MLWECLCRPFVRIKHREAIDLIRTLVRDKVKILGYDGKLSRQSKGKDVNIFFQIDTLAFSSSYSR